MSDPILPLAVWEEGTLQNDVPANDNSLRIEAMSRPVEAIANSPSVTDDGAVYIVGAAPSGAFSTFDPDDLTIYRGGTWYAWAPTEGLEANGYQYTGSGGWVTGGGGGLADVVDVESPVNSSGTVTLDFDSKSKYIGSITLAANVSTLAFANLPGSGKYAEYEIHIKQDGTGGRTFAIPASHKALGGSDTAIASAANAVTVLTASTVDNGTTWRYAMQESA